MAGLAGDLAGRIALALENARLAAQQRRSAEAWRAALVPPELPRIPGAELAVAHGLPEAAGAMGGDFYDVFPVPGGRWRFAVGEVCGSGPATATVTALARSTLRILAAEGHSIASVLGRLNELILAEKAAGVFLTLVHGELRHGERGRGGLGQKKTGPDSSLRLSLACAGLPLPLVLRAGATAPEPAADPQPLLGVIEGLTFTAQTVRLRRGDLLLCVTDGVTRRRDGDRLLDDDGGLARLLAGYAGLAADVVAARIGEEVRVFGGQPPDDGMALLTLRAAT